MELIWIYEKAKGHSVFVFPQFDTVIFFKNNFCKFVNILLDSSFFFIKQIQVTISY